MKAFISSPIRGLEPLRDAAARGITTLGHEVVRAEDFGVSPESPQTACLAAVRDSEAVVLILGSDYGYPQAPGLSATYEQYREARDSRPVLAFVEDRAKPWDEQPAFIREVQGWERGHYTSPFEGADDLQADQAVDDLIGSWSIERGQEWVIGSETIAVAPSPDRVVDHGIDLGDLASIAAGGELAPVSVGGCRSSTFRDWVSTATEHTFYPFGHAPRGNSDDFRPGSISGRARFVR